MRLPIAVMGICYRRKGDGIQYLLILRAPHDGGFWQPVTGGLEEGETRTDGVRREIAEETGLTPTSVTPLLEMRQFFHRYRSESTEVWLTEFVYGAEVPDGDVTLSPDHTDHKWCTLDEALTLLKYDGNKDALKLLDGALRSGKMPEQPCSSWKRSSSNDPVDIIASRVAVLLASCCSPVGAASP